MYKDNLVGPIKSQVVDILRNLIGIIKPHVDILCYLAGPLKSQVDILRYLVDILCSHTWIFCVHTRGYSRFSNCGLSRYSFSVNGEYEIATPRLIFQLLVTELYQKRTLFCHQNPPQI